VKEYGNESFSFAAILSRKLGVGYSDFDRCSLAVRSEPISLPTASLEHLLFEITSPSRAKDILQKKSLLMRDGLERYS